MNHLLKNQNTNILATVLLMFFISCAPMIPKNVKYSQELASSELLAEHSDYLLKAYEGTKKDEAYWGYYSILNGSILSLQYDIISLSLDSDTTNNILQHIPSIKSILTLHLSSYSEIWSKAISNHVRYEYSSIDFSSALAICKTEYKRMGIFDYVKTIKENVKLKTSQFERDKYSRTYEVYGLIAQLISLTEDPSGSLMSFNQTVNSLNVELDKVLALAELEH